MVGEEDVILDRLDSWSQVVVEGVVELVELDFDCVFVEVGQVQIGKLVRIVVLIKGMFCF